MGNYDKYCTMNASQTKRRRMGKTSSEPKGGIVVFLLHASRCSDRWDVMMCTNGKDFGFGFGYVWDFNTRLEFVCEPSAVHPVASGCGKMTRIFLFTTIGLSCGAKWHHRMKTGFRIMCHGIWPPSLCPFRNHSHHLACNSCRRANTVGVGPLSN